MRIDWLKKASLLLVLLLFAGCGGGGGSSSSSNPVTPSTQISGVAAAGAPIIGFAYLKDGNGTTLGPQEIAADGRFSFDVKGLTAPFILQAQGSAGGETYTLHSVALGAGTANINPLTNLVVAAASGGQAPNTVYDNWNSSSTDQQSVDSAVAAIRTALAPLLEAAKVVDSKTLDTFDPIQVHYVADPSQNPLDALFRESSDDQWWGRIGDDNGQKRQRYPAEHPDDHNGHL
jgi:hypothetical protein